MSYNKYTATDRKAISARITIPQRTRLVNSQSGHIASLCLRSGLVGKVAGAIVVAGGWLLTLLLPSSTPVCDCVSTAFTWNTSSSCPSGTLYRDNSGGTGVVGVGLRGSMEENRWR